MKISDIDQTYGETASVELRPGMGWALYSDDGPGGPCGQGMRTTCPHTVLMTWPDESSMKESLKVAKWRNKNHRLIFGVVDEYTAGGIFRVVVNEKTATTAAPPIRDTLFEDTPAASVRRDDG